MPLTHQDHSNLSMLKSFSQSWGIPFLASAGDRSMADKYQRLILRRLFYQHHFAQSRQCAHNGESGN